MKPDVLSEWLVGAGLRSLPFEELIDGFARRLNDAGIAAARLFVGMDTLHPLVRARSVIWDRSEGPATHYEFQHIEIDAPIIAQSPFAAMLRQGIERQQLDLTLPAVEGEPPVFAELRDAGMTEWLGRTFPLGESTPRLPTPHVAEAAGQLWLVCSVSTDRSGGFVESDIKRLDAILPLFALAVKATTARWIGQGLLASYLGIDPAARVFAGTVQRGEVLGVEAVLFYADLRDFTGFADRLPPRELIGLLDECFECMVRPLTRHGGEVLKFLGDGLLAIFSTERRRRDETCALALTAASEALDLMDLLAAKRVGAGQPTPSLDIALHVGEVLYGNVGADARLDFTVIGPAVNEAARIELLCKELGRNLLVSQAFAAAAGRSRDHLASLGRHRLRGVSEETELFTLAG
ncbi:adenylate/guanylate cyclase domain-containing protein [Enhydrobacter sp.]|jgi:adenylate cyclase|uniref:adenylate/guanylate cyclase domain-containing protein n=1 Tax=Enhydrobacter sp. TaxID=1894999 RepID=UPI002610E359|nr:adenylate/guanylate cyclase domain-containing protein [Enhydrobacter sp.]WIM12182.1 MAG: Adenylate cyclase / Guanylate cyclase [Enhydrobacter sp.]